MCVRTFKVVLLSVSIYQSGFANACWECTHGERGEKLEMWDVN